MSFTRADYEALVIHARNLNYWATYTKRLPPHHRIELNVMAGDIMRRAESVIGQQSGPRWWDVENDQSDVSP